MTNFGGIKPSMNIINHVWNTVLILCSSTERQAILLTPLDFQGAQKGVISNCAKKKKASYEMCKRWSYRCKMATVCIRGEIMLPNFTCQEGKTSARVLRWWRLSTLSVKVMYWVFQCQLAADNVKAQLRTVPWISQDTHVLQPSAVQSWCSQWCSLWDMALKHLT